MSAHPRQEGRPTGLEGMLKRHLSELPRLRARGDVRSVAGTLASMGRVHLKLGEVDSALECFKEAEEVVALGAVSAPAGLRLGRAELHLYRGERDAAQAILEGLVAELGEAAESEALAEAATLLGSVHRVHWLEDTHLQLVKAWGESIESKDHYTAGHCERVARYACVLARAVGFTPEDVKWFGIGGFLHDVGKTAVPAAILNKPARLNAAEWELMKRHTVVGDQMVAELHFPWDLRPIVRSHHERWDGTGYPDGLVGEDIPLTARILCIADIFDALTTARSYRPALSRSEALRIMKGESGRALDPELFPLFVSHVEELDDAAREVV